MTGTGQQLAGPTAGGVVTPAQVPLVAIPDPVHVTAEVQLENEGVGFVREEQGVAIKLEPFPFTRYGTIDSAVTNLPADAVIDERSPKNSAGQPVAVFLRLTLARGSIDVDGRMTKPTPGMNVTAEIKTGRRRVIDYLLSPLRQSVRRVRGSR